MRIVLRSAVVEYDRGLPSAKRALSGVDLSVREGEVVAVVGPTGSGKTTMLEVMAGLSRPTSGEAELADGVDGASLRSSVGLVYQFPEFQFFEATVYDDIAFGPRKQGLEEGDVRAMVADALERAALAPTEFSPRPPLSLSAGEKRRAAIACILVLGRPFLLLDEPTAGLDPENRGRIAELVASESRRGRGVVVVTHDLEFVDRIAERVVILVAGSVRADDHPSSVFTNRELLAEVGLGAPLRYSLVSMVEERSAETARRLRPLLLSGKALANGRA